MNFIVDHIAKNPFSRPAEKLEDVKAIIVHYTACPHATAKNIRDYFDNLKKQNSNDNIEDRSASAHYAVDDNCIIEIIPPDEVAYHVGAKKYTEIGKSFGKRSPNNYTIGIEMCHDDESGKFNSNTIKNAIELINFLLNKFELKKENIFRHFDITGKNCPKWFVENEKDWLFFKNTIG